MKSLQIILVGLFIAFHGAPVACGENTMEVLSESTETILTEDFEALDMVALGLDVSFPSGHGRTIRAQVVVLYDQPTGTTWWTYQEVVVNREEFDIRDILDRYHFVARGRELTGFLLLPRALWIRKPAGVYPTLTDARNSILQALEIYAPRSAREESPWWHHVPLSPCIPSDFFYRPMSASGELVAEISGVTEDDTGWRIELQGSADLEAILYLDSESSIVAVEGLPEKYEPPASCQRRKRTEK